MRRLSVVGLGLLALSCSGTPSPVPAVTRSEPYLTEIALHDDAPVSWPDGTGLAPEIMGPGVAVTDLDGDGLQDIVQLTMPEPGRPETVLARVWLQTPQRRFREAAAIDSHGFAQGVAVGDVDADGLPDLFFANYGPDRLLLNAGNGTFRPAPGPAPWESALWSSSAAFCDFDGDDDLDLYVAHYLDYDPGRACYAPSGAIAYCAPQVFDGALDHLYRNDGKGNFTDVSAAVGLILPDRGRHAKGLGVACADLTGDGRLDFYVANDGESNQLWVNDGSGGLVDEAVLRGAAVNRHGKPEASMGIALGDIDGDEALDLMLTHLEGENNTVYGGASPRFRDITPRTGMATHDFALTGFGCALFDLELDGDLDFVVVNGKVRRNGSTGGFDTGFWGRYAEPNQVFENRGDGSFVEVSGRERSWAMRREVTRGLAHGDLDNDGDTDLVIANADNGLRLYRNDAPRGENHWVRVSARTASGPALGARVTVHATGRRWIGVIPSGASYASSSDPRLLFGLGTATTVDRIDVVWPDGSREQFDGVVVDAEAVLVRGEGRPL